MCLKNCPGEHTCANTHTHVHMCTTHTTHTHAHTHTHARTHTHTHARTQRRTSPFLCSVSYLSGHTPQLLVSVSRYMLPAQLSVHGSGSVSASHSSLFLPSLACLLQVRCHWAWGQRGQGWEGEPGHKHTHTHWGRRPARVDARNTHQICTVFAGCNFHESAHA